MSYRQVWVGNCIRLGGGSSVFDYRCCADPPRDMAGAGGGGGVAHIPIVRWGASRTTECRTDTCAHPGYWHRYGWNKLPCRDACLLTNTEQDSPYLSVAAGPALALGTAEE